MTEPRGYGFFIKRINTCLDIEANRNLQNRNLTRTQSHFIMELHRCPEHAATLKEMESRFSSAQSTIAGVAVRLEKKGLIQRYSLPTDKRVKLVRLTEEGEAMCDVSLREIIQSEELLTSAMTPEEQETFLSLLRRAYGTVHKENPHASTDPSWPDEDKEPV